MRRNVDVEAAVVAKYVVLEPVLDERGRRLSLRGHRVLRGTKVRRSRDGRTTPDVTGR
jgi:hypothetical protein